MLLEHIGQPLQIGESAQIKLELSLSLPSPWTKPRSDYFWSNCEVSHIFLIGITRSGLCYFHFIEVNPLLLTFMNSTLPCCSEGLLFKICTVEGWLFQPGQTGKIILNQPNTAKQGTRIPTSALAVLKEQRGLVKVWEMSCLVCWAEAQVSNGLTVTAQSEKGFPWLRAGCISSRQSLAWCAPDTAVSYQH